MRNPWLFLSLALVACASRPTTPTPTASEKDFAVPSVLQDQFAVRDSGIPVAPPPAKPEAPAVPAPSPEKKLTKKERQALEKAKKEAMKAQAKAAAEAAKQGKPLPIPNRWTMAPVFKVGERIVFDITYFGATAGQLELEVLPNKVVAERPTYHFRAVASSTSIFSLFYRVNDVAESFMDTEGLFSHKFSIKLDESRQTRDVLELYDHNKRKAYYWSKLETPTKKQNDQSEIELTPFAQDGLSSFFYVRTLPLELGKSYDFPVLNNGKLRNVKVTALRKEELVTKVGTYKAIVVKPEVMLDGVLQSYGDSFIWISDDADRQILKIDAKIKVGSVIGYLRERSYGPGASADAAR